MVLTGIYIYYSLKYVYFFMEEEDKLLLKVRKKLMFLELLFGLIRHWNNVIINIGIVIIIMYMVIYLDCGG